MHINVIKKDFISGGFMGNGVQGLYSMRHDFELYFNLCNCICISKGDHQTQN